jgi:hypothetical protein
MPSPLCDIEVFLRKKPPVLEEIIVHLWLISQEIGSDTISNRRAGVV